MPTSARITAFADIIRTQLPAGATILEIGAGDGALATVLTKHGYDVTAIDPKPRDGFPAVPASFEDFERDAPFDCVAAQLVIHHAHDLDAFVAKMARLTKPGGIVAIDDYGWERSDDAAFRAARTDLHPSTAVLRALDRHLTRVAYADHAYGDDPAAGDRIAFTYLGTPAPG